MLHQNVSVFGEISENLNKEMKLKKAQLIQFSMPESNRNMFLDHFGHIRDFIVDSVRWAWIVCMDYVVFGFFSAFICMDSENVQAQPLLLFQS